MKYITLVQLQYQYAKIHKHACFKKKKKIQPYREKEAITEPLTNFL